ncbi:MAG TPA: AsmA-like C-terminal region-containing protein [Mucilaginibacter sp.]|nr:AsmA-like C-terminal region-containing protein [Mucilaginibacter sp.]
MPRTLKIILKLIAGIAIIVVLVFFGLLWYVNSHKESVLKMVNTELNNKLDGTIVIGDMKPNFFKRLPDISLGLSNVLVRDKRFTQHHRTLLDAKDLSISVNAWALLKGSININYIDISNAAVVIFTDSSGYSNQSIFKKGPKKTKEAGSTNNYDSQLGRLKLSNVNFKVEDQRAKKTFDFIANNLDGKMANLDTGWSTAFHMDVTAKSMAFNTRKGSFIKDKVIEGDLTAGYNQDSGRMWVKSASLDIGDDPFEVNAVFETLKKPSSFTFHLAAKQILWRRVSTLLAANIKEKLDQFNITRPIAVTGIISGSFAGGEPSLYITTVVKDNTVITPGGTIDDCSFDGVFSNQYQKGKKNSDENSVIRLVRMKGSYRHMPFAIDTGSIINLDKPIATGNFRADFPLINFNEIMGNKVARFTKGTARMNLQYKGDIVNYRLNKPAIAGSIILRNANFTYVPENLKLQNGSIALYFKGNDLLLKNIRLQSGRSVVYMEGRINNFLNFYYNAPEKILFTWQVNSPQLYLGEFLGFISGAEKKEKKGATPKGNSGNVIDQLSNVLEKGQAEMHLNVAQVHYLRFLATDVHADLLTSEDRIVIHNVGLKHAGGFLKMNGSVEKGETTNRLALKTVISHVDVHEFFDAFNNFGLKDFTSENLTGYLSAKTQITAEMSDQASILPGSVNGTLDLNLQNGALINFNPIGSIGKFAFPFRNLKNIRVRELNARFDVHGDLITIYPLKFSSSVLNMDVAGVYGLKKGTDLTLDIPLRNPKNDTTIQDQEKLNKKRYKGIVLHIRAKADSTGKIKVGWNKDRKKD